MSTELHIATAPYGFICRVSLLFLKCFPGSTQRQPLALLDKCVRGWNVLFCTVSYHKAGKVEYKLSRFIMSHKKGSCTCKWREREKCVREVKRLSTVHIRKVAMYIRRTWRCFFMWRTFRGANRHRDEKLRGASAVYFSPSWTTSHAPLNGSKPPCMPYLGRAIMCMRRVLCFWWLVSSILDASLALRWFCVSFCHLCSEATQSGAATARCAVHWTAKPDKPHVSPSNLSSRASGFVSGGSFCPETVSSCWNEG